MHVHIIDKHLVAAVIPHSEHVDITDRLADDDTLGTVTLHQLIPLLDSLCLLEAQLR